MQKTSYIFNENNSNEYTYNLVDKDSRSTRYRRKRKQSVLGIKYSLSVFI